MVGRKTPYLSISPDASSTSRVFCFPHGGAGASAYSAWRGLLPAGVQLCAVQLPGREHRLRDQPFVRWEPMLRDLIPTLEAWCDLPFAVFGHSMGGLIAFEVAKALRDLGRPPEVLAVSGVRPPHERELFERFSDLPDREFLDEIVRRYNGLPKEVLQNPELLELVLKVLRADTKLVEDYRLVASEPLACPLTCFAGDRDNGAPPSAMRGWAGYSRGPITMRTLSGDHFFLRDHARTVVEEVVRHLPP